jgi:tetratricopeptide (TPR) repeat protein
MMLYQVKNQRKLCEFGAPHKSVTAAQFIGQTKSILSCGNDDAVTLWDLDYFVNPSKALGKHANTKERILELGRWYKFRGLWAWSRALLEESRKNKLEVSDIELARLHWQSGDLEAARSIFERLKAEPKEEYYASLCLRGFAATLKGRAFKRFQRGEISAALADYSAAIKIAPEWGELWFWRGSVRAAQRQYNKARNNYNRAFQLGFQTAQLHYRRAMAHLSLRDFNSAKSDFDRSIKMSPNRVEPYIGRGTLHGMMRREKQAQDDYTRAIELKPKSPVSYTHRGLSYAISRMNVKAIADYNKAVALDKYFITARLNRGYFFLKQGQFKKAITDFDVVLKEQPRNPMVHRFRAEALYSLERWDEALKAFNSAIIYKPGDYRNYYSRGNVHRVLKNYKQAVADYKRYLAMAKPQRRIKDLDEYIRWAEAKISGKELGSAPLAKGATKQQVNDRFHYAFSLYEDKNYDKSEAIYREIEALLAERDPRRKSLYYDWSCVLALKKDIDRAFEALGKSIAAGFKNRDHMSTDKDLIILHKDKRWKPLLESIK